MTEELKVNKSTPIRVYPDGPMWCALIGEDIQSGIAGFGRSPEKAVVSLMDQPGAIEATPHAVYETVCDQCGVAQVSVAPYPVDSDGLECSSCGYMIPIEQDLMR